MTLLKLVRLQELLVDDICILAGHITRISYIHLPLDDYEMRGSFLHTTLLLRRRQLKVVQQLLEEKYNGKS